jgi:hypothetical protein
MASILVVALMAVPSIIHAQTNGPSTSPNDGVEDLVSKYFADAPVMIAVASCESDFHQFDDASGKPLHGGYKKHMVGIFQILDGLHRDVAIALGFDIDTIEGNIKYARYLYDHDGTTPWLDSASCWQKGHVAVRHHATDSTDVTTSVDADNQVSISGVHVSSWQSLFSPLSFGTTGPIAKAM